MLFKISFSSLLFHTHKPGKNTAPVKQYSKLKERTGVLMPVLIGAIVVDQLDELPVSSWLSH